MQSVNEIYDSAKRRHPAIEELINVFKYKDLFIQLIRRDLVSRYKRSILGVAWTLLNPLGTMLVMTIVFSRVFGGVQFYPVYVLSGLLVWNFFSQTTQHSMDSLLWGSTLLKKIYLPRSAFILSSIGTGVVNFILSLIPLFIIMLILKSPISLSLIMIPVFILCLAFFSLGVGLFLSAYSIYFPDISDMYIIVLRAWMYLSPVIIPEDTLSGFLNGFVLKLNPLYYIIKTFRLIIYEGKFPSPKLFLATFAISLIMFVIGWIVFTKRADEFAYHI